MRSSGLATSQPSGLSLLPQLLPFRSSGTLLDRGAWWAVVARIRTSTTSDEASRFSNDPPWTATATMVNGPTINLENSSRP